MLSNFCMINSFHRMLRQQVTLKSILELFKQSVQVAYYFSMVLYEGLFCVYQLVYVNLPGCTFYSVRIKETCTGFQEHTSSKS